MMWLFHEMNLNLHKICFGFLSLSQAERRILRNQINYFKMFELITSKSNLLLKGFFFSLSASSLRLAHAASDVAEKETMGKASE